MEIPYLNEVVCGDCIDLMKDLPDGCIDMVLADLPYGTTQNKWDSVIDLASLWKEYKRIIKTNGAIVLTAQTPFDKVLGVSNLQWLKYEWIWEKEAGTGFLNAKRYPLKSHENILVFCDKPHLYNPQMETGTPYSCKKGGPTTNYNKDSKNNIVTNNNGTRYPKTVLRFARDKIKLHPTQKPLKLFEYLIKTYTNENDLVLDNCAGSFTTAVASENLKRGWVCMEKDFKYSEIGKERIKENRMRLCNIKQL